MGLMCPLKAGVVEQPLLADMRPRRRGPGRVTRSPLLGHCYAQHNRPSRPAGGQRGGDPERSLASPISPPKSGHSKFDMSGR